MFSGTLIVIVILLVAIWLWQSNMQAKEAALNACKTLCKTHNLQLLDDTISLKKFRLRRGNNGTIQFLRIYAFEYNTEGQIQTRRVGEITLLGRQVIDQGLFSQSTLTPAPHTEDEKTVTTKPSAQIIDFRQYQAKNDEKHPQ